MKNKTLTPDLLQILDAYWRATNYLSVGQMVLFDIPLLRRPLELTDVSSAMLPCNVIHLEVDGGVEVSAIDPEASMQAIEIPELHAVAGQIRDLSKKAVEAI